MSVTVTNFLDYQSLAIRTMRDDPFLAQLSHCAMGMSGEAAELLELVVTNEEGVVGELGDCMWYAAVMSHVMGIKFTDVLAASYLSDDRPYSHLDHISQMVIWSGRIVERIKKTVYYGKELKSEELVGELAQFLRAIVDHCNSLGVRPIDVAEANIRKLEARYPDGRFCSTLAINRDYAGEAVAAGIAVV